MYWHLDNGKRIKLFKLKEWAGIPWDYVVIDVFGRRWKRGDAPGLAGVGEYCAYGYEIPEAPKKEAIWNIPDPTPFVFDDDGSEENTDA